MDLNELLQRHCVELPKGTPTLTPAQVQEYVPLVPDWEVVNDGKGLRREIRFDDFMATITFTHLIAEIAEDEQHHPDIDIHAYRWVTLDLSTHSIGGLSENDFIMAARINQLLNMAPELGSGQPS